MRLTPEPDGYLFKSETKLGKVDQKWAKVRIPVLLDTPAAVRFISAEPLLGPLDLTPWLPGLDWVIVGGESGPGHRPINPAWVRSIRDQCTQSHGGTSSTRCPTCSMTRSLTNTSPTSTT